MSHFLKCLCSLISQIITKVDLLALIGLNDTAPLDPFVVSSQKNPEEIEVKLDRRVLDVFSSSTELNLSILS